MFPRSLKDLTEFAIKTLSCSPTGTSVERSFSLQGQIHTKNRNRLKSEKVAKLKFCRWNIGFVNGEKIDRQEMKSALLHTEIAVYTEEEDREKNSGYYSQHSDSDDMDEQDVQNASFDMDE